MLCSDISASALCLADEVQRRIAAICGLEDNKVQPDWSPNMPAPRAVVRDLSETNQSGSTDHRHAIRTFRIRYFGISKADCYSRRLALKAMDRDPMYVTQEGYATPYRVIMAEVTKTMGEWRVEMSLQLCQNECIPD